jgi:hypothetical protein
MVVLMGAFEAGYLDGVKRRLRGGARRPPPLPPGSEI